MIATQFNIITVRLPKLMLSEIHSIACEAVVSESNVISGLCEKIGEIFFINKDNFFTSDMLQYIMNLSDKDKKAIYPVQQINYYSPVEFKISRKVADMIKSHLSYFLGLRTESTYRVLIHYMIFTMDRKDLIQFLKNMFSMDQILDEMQSL